MTDAQAKEILQELPDKIIGIIMPMYIEFDYKEAINVAISALEERIGRTNLAERG